MTDVGGMDDGEGETAVAREIIIRLLGFFLWAVGPLNHVHKMIPGRDRDGKQRQ